MPTQTQAGAHAHANRPSHALPRKYVEPILYLAHRMATLEKAAGKQSLAQHLATAAGISDYRTQHWFHALNDRRACELLETETAKRAALIVLALISKAEFDSDEPHRAYFSKIRDLFGAEPISIPKDVEEHKRLALAYLVD
jgi:hypothetical protein